MRRARKLTGLIVLVAARAGWVSAASAEDSPPPTDPTARATAGAALRSRGRSAESLKLPSFLSDMDFRVHFRTYYFNPTKPDE
jgi:hypothetical protein